MTSEGRDGPKSTKATTAIAPIPSITGQESPHRYRDLGAKLVFGSTQRQTGSLLSESSEAVSDRISCEFLFRSYKKDLGLQNSSFALEKLISYQSALALMDRTWAFQDRRPLIPKGKRILRVGLEFQVTYLF